MESGSIVKINEKISEYERSLIRDLDRIRKCGGDDVMEYITHGQLYAVRKIQKTINNETTNRNNN